MAHADEGWDTITFPYSNDPFLSHPARAAWCHGSCFALVCLGYSKAFKGLRAVPHVPRDAYHDGHDDARVSRAQRNCGMTTHRNPWKNVIGSSSTGERDISVYILASTISIKLTP